MSNQTQLRIRLVRSPIGARVPDKATVRALGLHRLGQEVVKEDSPALRGMLQAVRHLVDVTNVTNEEK
ncbi:MAG: 50S ribosomal protein L30 [Anaerolineae bacterium]